jgi:hypothetical protein
LQRLLSLAPLFFGYPGETAKLRLVGSVGSQTLPHPDATPLTFHGSLLISTYQRTLRRYEWNGNCKFIDKRFNLAAHERKQASPFAPLWLFTIKKRSLQLVLQRKGFRKSLLLRTTQKTQATQPRAVEPQGGYVVCAARSLGH